MDTVFGAIRATHERNHSSVFPPFGCVSRLKEKKKWSAPHLCGMERNGSMLNLLSPLTGPASSWAYLIGGNMPIRAWKYALNVALSIGSQELGE